MNEQLKKEIREKSKFGAMCDKYLLQYQSVDGAKGVRDMIHRSEVMGLDSFDFSDKSVLDIGCNLGAVGIGCMQRGASKYVGLEHNASTVEVSAKFFEEEGVAHKGRVFQYDVDSGLDECRKLIGDDKYDYVFALAIIMHVNDNNLFNLINFYSSKTIFFEGHNFTPGRRYRTLRGLRRKTTTNEQNQDEWAFRLGDVLDNTRVKYLGNTHDSGNRVVFLIEK